MRSLLATFLLIALSISTFAQTDAGSNGSCYNYGAGDGSARAPDAFFFGAGPGVLDNLDANDWSVQFFGGKQWGLNRYLAPKAVLEATTDFGASLLTSALIGANLYPVSSTITPYLGAGAGVGYAKSSNSQSSDVFGFDLGSSFGLLMFKGSPLEVNVETNANFIFRDIGNNTGMPMSFTARVGILF